MKSQKIKNHEIGIFSCARTSSRRCKRKMVRRFGNSTLTDILLYKLSKLGKHTFFAGYEPIFKKKCKKFNIRFVQRSKKSAESRGPSLEIFNFLKDQNYKYFLFISGCIPNLKIETIKKFIKLCKEQRKSAFAVFKTQNYFLNKNNKPINFKFKKLQLDTSKVKIVKEFSNIFYFFEKKYFFKHGVYWNWEKLRYVNLEKNIETTDIDNEKDFKLAEIIWKNNR